MGEIANAEQFEAWNGASGQRWVTAADRRDRQIAPVADALFAAVQLARGESVLDLGCGCGATTLAAGAAVGTGRVLGVDLSGPMLEVARGRRDAAGLTNVEFEQGDVQVHPLPVEAFDAAISRFGTMFYADAAAAFSNVARALRPGGRIAIATWQPLAANDWLTIPANAMQPFAGAPADASTGSAMFGQSDPARVQATLHDAGFTAIDVTATTVMLVLGTDPADAAAQVGDSGVGRAVLDSVPEADQRAAIAAVEEVLRAHTSDAGVLLRGAILLTTARK